jgi:serine/threonine protein kinase
VNTLQKINGSNKGLKHLNRLLLSFQHDDKDYLLFPWAYGNLRELWKRYPRPNTDKAHVTWVLKQCRGLATGLRKMHSSTTWPNPPPEPGLSAGPSLDKNFGTHGDIKPENVLFFDSDAGNKARLVIADFGLSRFNSKLSRSHIPVDLSRACTVTYRPPEYDLHMTEGQSYDIWCLGCLYLEFISWSLHGQYMCLDEFGQARMDDDARIFASEYREDKFFNLHIDPQNAQAVANSEPAGQKANASEVIYTARIKDSVRSVSLKDSPGLNQSVILCCA